MTEKCYTINSDKLEEIIRLFNNNVDPKATDEVIELTICADWNEEEEHQEWINNSSVEEIVDWLASFYED